MKKKMLSILLAGIFVLSAAGCGSGGETNQSEAETGSQVQATEEADASAEGEMRTITVLGQENRFFSQGMLTAEREEYGYWQQFEEELAQRNLKLEVEVVSRDQFSTVIQTRMASGDLPDFVNISCLDDDTALEMAKGGLLLPINKLLEENGGEEALAYIKEKLPFITKRLTADDGNFYWIPTASVMSYQGQPASTGTAMNIRKDWLDALGLEVPATAEEFKEVLHAFQDQDVNGNGANDEIMYLDPTAALFSDGVAQWFGLGNGLVAYDITNQQVVCPWYQDGVKDYLQYVKELIDEGLVDTSLIGLASTEQVDQRVAENKVGAESAWIMETWLEPTITGAENPLYMPIGPLNALEGVDPYIVLEDPNTTFSKFAVSSNCKDPEAIADLLNYLFTDECAQFTVYGVEGESFQNTEGYNELIGVYTGDNKEAQVAEKKALLYDLVGYDAILPSIRYADLSSEINNVVAEKADFQKEIINYEPTLAMDIKTYQALPTSEESARLGEIRTDLETYSKELIANLILGRLSLDDWDSYMEELKELGLDEYIEINQTLCDRYNAAE